MSAIRNAILDSVRAGRENRATIEKGKLDFGEHILRIPEQDFEALKQIFPKLEAKDPLEQKAEWERFFASDFALAYRVARTPVEVQRSPRRGIIV